MTITTDKNGYAATGNNVLPYGTYRVQESKTNDSMLNTWEGQTVTFNENPEIGTKASVDGEKKDEPEEKVTITDTVSYTKLTLGKEYIVSGVLMDKSTGEALLVNGEQVTAESTFTATQPSGTLEMSFAFDASALAGKSVVVFESLYRDGKEVTAHADINDDGQTVTFSENPEIGTIALCLR